MPEPLPLSARNYGPGFAIACDPNIDPFLGVLLVPSHFATWSLSLRRDGTVQTRRYCVKSDIVALSIPSHRLVPIGLRAHILVHCVALALQPSHPVQTRYSQPVNHIIPRRLLRFWPMAM